MEKPKLIQANHLWAIEVVGGKYSGIVAPDIWADEPDPLVFLTKAAAKNAINALCFRYSMYELKFKIIRFNREK